MIENNPTILSFEKSATSPWPLEANLNESHLVFSGKFSPARLALEQSRKFLSRVSFFVSWVFVAVGVLVLLYATYAYGVVERNAGFLFENHTLFILLWTGVIALCFLWAYRYSKLIFKAELAKQKNGVVDVFNFFNPEARQAWATVSSQSAAGVPSAEALLIELLKQAEIGVAFLRFGLDRQEALRSLGEGVHESAIPGSVVEQLPFQSFVEAKRSNIQTITPMSLVVSLIKQVDETHPLAKLFFRSNLTPERLTALSLWSSSFSQLLEQDREMHEVARHRSDRGINLALTAVPTPYLDQFSRDLTVLAKYRQLPLSSGRQQDTLAVSSLLSAGQNVLVVGDVGSGRTTVLYDLAYSMSGEAVPEGLQDMRLVELELAAISGGSVPPQQVLLSLLNEAREVGNIVLALPDLELLAKARTSDGLVLLDFLLGHIAGTGLRIVATSTPDSYQMKLKVSPQFDKEFAVHELAGLVGQDLLLACCVQASILEAQTGVLFQLQAVEESIALADKLVHDTAPPQGAVNFLKEAAKITSSRPPKERLVTVEDVQNAAASLTHVPSAALGQAESSKLLNLEVDLGQFIVGQQAAVTAVAEGLRRARSGLVSSERPLASFLFVGPTGVGKTEVARALTKVYFGDEKYLLRIDMSEYQGQDGVNKLLGRAGSEESTTFVSHLKTYPFCLFLLDELEKASGQVLNLFLQVLEDGRLTTGSGQTLDLRQTIIIATSNAGTSQIQELIQQGKDPGVIEKELKQHILPEVFRPEFLNRFDSIILFQPLVQGEIARVAELQLSSLSEKLMQKRIEVSFTEAAVHKVATEGYDQLLGARPVRRYIQDHVESVLAKLLLSGGVTPGTRIKIDAGALPNEFKVLE